MARWKPDARERLKQAALDLYAERGYENTTVAEIAERAGLTERTFFRHFADKREVLFTGAIRDVFMESLASASTSTSPQERVVAAYVAGAQALEEQRESSRARQRLVATDPALRERGLVKNAALAESMAGVLEEQGVPAPDAALAAAVGGAIYQTAVRQWMDSEDRLLPDLVRETASRLEAAGQPV